MNDAEIRAFLAEAVADVEGLRMHAAFFECEVDLDAVDLEGPRAPVSFVEKPRYVVSATLYDEENVPKRAWTIDVAAPFSASAAISAFVRFHLLSPFAAALLSARVGVDLDTRPEPYRWRTEKVFRTASVLVLFDEEWAAEM